MTFDDVERFALQNDRADEVLKTDFTFNGYELYSVSLKKEYCKGMNGLPVYILARDGDIRYPNGTELLQILDLDK